jgi:hypothetical protein
MMPFIASKCPKVHSFPWSAFDPELHFGIFDWILTLLSNVQIALKGGVIVGTLFFPSTWSIQ